MGIIQCMRCTALERISNNKSTRLVMVSNVDYMARGPSDNDIVRASARRHTACDLQMKVVEFRE